MKVMNFIFGQKSPKTEGKPVLNSGQKVLYTRDAKPADAGTNIGAIFRGLFAALAQRISLAFQRVERSTAPLQHIFADRKPGRKASAFGQAVTIPKRSTAPETEGTALSSHAMGRPVTLYEGASTSPAPLSPHPASPSNTEPANPTQTPVPTEQSGSKTESSIQLPHHLPAQDVQQGEHLDAMLQSIQDDKNPKTTAQTVAQHSLASVPSALPQLKVPADVLWQDVTQNPAFRANFAQYQMLKGDLEDAFEIYGALTSSAKTSPSASKDRAVPEASLSLLFTLDTLLNLELAPESKEALQAMRNAIKNNVLKRASHQCSVCKPERFEESREGNALCPGHHYA